MGLLLIAGCTSPEGDPDTGGGDANDDELSPEEVQGGTGQGGGQVVNSAPTVRTFSGTPTAGNNDGTLVVTFSGTVFDPNTELQLKSLRLAASGAHTVASTHVVTAAEAIATSEPAGFGADGWKVWSGTAPPDGVLQYKFRYTVAEFAPSGAWNWALTVTDKSDAAGTSAVVTVNVAPFARVEVSSTPVDATGAPVSGAGWGAWNAQAGAANVPSTNYIVISNTGDQDAITVVLDFTQSEFSGTNATAGGEIPIDGNIQFAWFEDTTPGTSAPSEGTFTFGSTSATGSVEVSFTGQGNIIYVTYRVVGLPDVLPIDVYGASYTVTEL